MSEDLREHIEGLTNMVRSDVTTPVIAGYMLGWWGTSVAVLSLVSLALFELELETYVSALWLGGVVLSWLGGRLFARRFNLKGKHGAHTRANRITCVIWLTTGVASGAIIGAETLQWIELGVRGYLLVFILCACALAGTSIAISEPLLLLSAIGWVLVAVISFMIEVTQPVLFAMTAIAAGLFLAVPGIIIAQRE